MMQKCLLLLSGLFLFLISSGQSQDSLLYYDTELAKLRRKSDSALRDSEAYRVATAGRYRHIKSSKDYGGVALLSGIMHSDYKVFNQQIAQDGFKSLPAISPMIGFGISVSSDRTVFDWYFVHGTLGGESKKGEERVHSSLFNVLRMDFGYKVVSSRIFHLYPYLGMAYREANISYSKPTEINPGFTSISNILINSNSISMSSSRIGIQAGLGIDILLKDHQYHNIMLFIKPGINKPLWKDKYKYKDIPYDPKIKHGDWQVSFGVKFGNK